MMRGTVYMIRDDGNGHRTIRRTVEQLDMASTSEQFRTIFLMAAPPDVSIEFGPIGPPWRKVQGS